MSWLNFQQCLGFGADAFVDKVDCNFEGSNSSTFTIAALEHPELTLLHCELNVLHVLKIVLELLHVV